MCEFQEKIEENDQKKNPTTLSEKIKNGNEISKTGRPYEPQPIMFTFEEALALTKFGKFNYFLIFICGALLATVLLETLGISFVLPVSQCDLELTTQDKGILSAIGFGGIITSSPLWGFLADKTGRKKVILPALLLSFTFAVLSSLAKNFWTLIVLRYLNGFFVSGPSATVYAYLGEFHTVKHRSRAIMYASGIFGLTCIALPLMAWLVINQQWQFHIPVIDVVFKPWRLFLIVCGLPSFVCALAMMKLPESPRFHLSQGRQSEAKEILQLMYRMNNGKTIEKLHIDGIIDEVEVNMTATTMDLNKSAGKIARIIHSIKVQTFPLFMAPHLKKIVIACAIQFSIFVSSNGMYMFFPLILNRMAEFSEENYDKSQATICEILSATKINYTDIRSTNETLNCELDISAYQHTLALELFYAIGFALMGLIINRLGKLPILFFILVGCGVSGLLTIFVNVPIFAIYLYLILLLCGLGVPVVNAATVDLFPTNLRAMAICISLMMGRLGSVVGTSTVGLLLDNYCELTFTISGSLLIFCGMLAFFIPNIRKKTEKQGIKNVSMAHRQSISSIGR